MALVLVATSVSADTIVVRSKQHEGELEKFEHGKFTFSIPFGDTLQIPASSVKSLKLDRPRPVKLFLAGKADAEAANLHGFQQSKFTFEQKGGMRMVYAMKVKRIVVEKPKPSAGRASHDAPGPRQFVDISHIEHRKDLPPNQMTALHQYTQARDRYKSYLAESSRLVAAMDTAKGDRRLQMLTELRTRKNNEQPLLLALDEAEEALFAAFPPPAE